MRASAQLPPPTIARDQRRRAANRFPGADPSLAGALVCGERELGLSRKPSSLSSLPPVSTIALGISRLPIEDSAPFRAHLGADLAPRGEQFPCNRDIALLALKNGIQ